MINRHVLINLGLIGLILALVVGNVLLAHPDPEERNGTIMKGMTSSRAIYAQEENPFGEQGVNRGMPVEGTIPAGKKAYPFGKGMQESERAGEALRNPFKRDDQASIARGKLVYERMCMACHTGKTSEGVREVGKRGGPVGPALLSQRVNGLKDGYIFNYITKGGALMPAHGAQIPEDDRWKAINYIRHAYSNGAK